MEIPKNPTNFKELRAFLLLGGVTFADIAREGGWGRGYVTDVARRYWGKPQRPRAILSMAILMKIEATIHRIQQGTTDEAEAQAS